MGFFKLSQEQKERRAFKQITKKRNTLAARQAFAEEAEKVARERARIRARRPSIGQILSERVSGSVRRTATGTRIRASPIRKRRKTTVRIAPVKRRKTTVRRRTTTRKTQAEQKPINFSEGIFS